MSDQCRNHSRIEFSSIVRTFSASIFASICSFIFDENGSQNHPISSLRTKPFGTLFATFSAGRLLDAFWSPFGSLWAPFGSPWLSSRLAPLGSLWAPFGSLLAPFWFPLAPFWLPLAPSGNLLAPSGSLLGSFWLNFDRLGGHFFHCWVPPGVIFCVFNKLPTKI